MDLEDFTARGTFEGAREKIKGLTLGFDIRPGESFVWPCGGCGSYKNNFALADDRSHVYCMKCKKIAAFASHYRCPGCEHCRPRK